MSALMLVAELIQPATTPDETRDAVQNSNTDAGDEVSRPAAQRRHMLPVHGVSGMMRFARLAAAFVVLPIAGSCDVSTTVDSGPTAISYFRAGTAEDLRKGAVEYRAIVVGKINEPDLHDECRVT